MNLAIAHESEAMRHALDVVVRSVRGWSLAWEVADPIAAVARCADERPDLLLLQSSPAAVQATRRIMRSTPCVIVLIADPREPDAASVFEAMSAGAVDVALSPIVDSHGRLAGADMLQKIQRAARLLRTSARPHAAVAPPRPAADGTVSPLVVLGASTGGPAALVKVLSVVPARTDVAIAVIQHVATEFCAELARWLGAQVALPVRVAMLGDRLRPGVITVAGGSRDLVVTASRDLAYRRASRKSFYHPSIDVFFTSLAEHWPRPGLAILLTGIGRDGAEGLLSLRQAGWSTIAQDQSSSVVYGMPKAAVEVQAAEHVLPLDQIGLAVQRFMAALPSTGGSSA